MSKIKIMLFDIDGVLIRLPYYFSKELEKQGYANAGEILSSFFHGEDNIQCLEGNASSQEMIMPYLKKIGWKGTAENYFKRQFNFESQYLDHGLISLVKKFQDRGIKCYLCTDQIKNRARFLLKEMDFQNIFSGYFISCYIGYRKCHDSFWTHAIDELKKEFSHIKPSEIVFFDDIQNNIDVSLKHGVQSFLFKDMAQFEKDLTSISPMCKV